MEPAEPGIVPEIDGRSDCTGLTKVFGCERIMTASSVFGAVLPYSGPVAQLGARFHGMEEVVGSIPTRSTNFILLKINTLI
jgi:hypothetical protein